MATEKENKELRKQKRIAQARKDHPNGTCLLARDNPNNHRLFPNGPFGEVDIDSTVCPSPDKCPHYHYQNDDPNLHPKEAENVPIHLLIASFRDKLCARTLHNAFTRAKNPKRLTFRVIQQTKIDSDLEDDEGCWDRYCDKYNPNCQEYQDQVRIIPVDSSQSQGPTWARSRLSAMVSWDYQHKDQSDKLDFQPIQMNDFCMQTDSHMDFHDDFDVGLVEMFHRTQNDYAVLSTYVADMEQNNQDPTNVPHLCQVEFTSSIRNWGTKECNFLTKPKMTNAMWGAGLSFHRCHAEINVPVDPYLDNVFDGEEGSRGIRFFTHGYDVYTPDRVLVTHDYHGHQSNPVVHTWGGKRNKGKKQVPETEWDWWQDIKANRGSLTIFGSRRVNMILGFGKKEKLFTDPSHTIEIDRVKASRYGIGNKRTLEQAEKFTGINFTARKMDVNKCGNLLWVPYEESSNYGVGDILSRGHSGEKTNVYQVAPDANAAVRALDTNRAKVEVSIQRDVVAFDDRNTSSSMDCKLLGGLCFVVIAVLLKIFAGKQKMDNKKH